MMVPFVYVGLTRLKEALAIDKNVQPGRVLVSAMEIIDKYNAASALSFKSSHPLPTK
jgi:hypothetical protein